MKEYTLNSNIDMETFLTKLYAKTYKFSYIGRLEHWDVDGFFIKKEKENNFQIYYHTAYYNGFYRIKINVMPTAGGIHINAKSSRNILTSWNFGHKGFDLIVNLLNEICLIGN